jgi:AcrR family transcriptional regulator
MARKKSISAPPTAQRPRRGPATGNDAKPGRRAANKAQTQRKIVAAALALFTSKGFEATTTKAIAKKAGIAEGTIFNYFRTKDDIALHFFEQEVEDAVDSVRGNVRMRNAPLDEKLFALIQRQLELLAPYEGFIGSAFVEALRPTSGLGVFSHRSHALRHRYMAFVQELMEESLPKKKALPLAGWAPDAFWVFYMVVLLFWLHDESPRKQSTLAFLDRSLKIGTSILKRAI